MLAVNSSAPKDDIAQVRRALHNMMSRADVREQMQEAGLRDIGKTIPRFFLIQEYQKFKKIINRINVDAK